MSRGIYSENLNQVYQFGDQSKRLTNYRLVAGRGLQSAAAGTDEVLQHCRPSQGCITCRDWPELKGIYLDISFYLILTYKINDYCLLLITSRGQLIKFSPSSPLSLSFLGKS